MADGAYECRRCGKRFNKYRSLSRRGYCPGGCGVVVMLENAEQLHDGAGPAVERWLDGIAKHIRAGAAGGDRQQSDGAQG